MHEKNLRVRVLADSRRFLVHDRVHDPRRYALGAQHENALRHANQDDDLDPLAPRIDREAQKQQSRVWADAEVARRVDICVKCTGGIDENDPRR